MAIKKRTLGIIPANATFTAGDHVITGDNTFSGDNSFTGDNEFTGLNDFTDGELILPVDTPINAVAADVEFTVNARPADYIANVFAYEDFEVKTLPLINVNANRTYEVVGTPAVNVQSSKEITCDSVPAVNVFSYVETAQAGNEDLRFTAVAKGTAGDGITIQYLDNGDLPLAISVVGTTIEVQLEVSNGSPVLTASQLMAAFNLDVNMSALVTTSLKAGSDGSGIPFDMAAVVTTAGGVSAGTFKFDNTGVSFTFVSGSPSATEIIAVTGDIPATVANIIAITPDTTDRYTVEAGSTTSKFKIVADVALPGTNGDGITSSETGGNFTGEGATTGGVNATTFVIGLQTFKAVSADPGALEFLSSATLSAVRDSIVAKSPLTKVTIAAGAGNTFVITHTDAGVAGNGYTITPDDVKITGTANLANGVAADTIVFDDGGADEKTCTFVDNATVTPGALDIKRGANVAGCAANIVATGNGATRYTIHASTPADAFFKIRATALGALGNALPGRVTITVDGARIDPVGSATGTAVTANGVTELYAPYEVNSIDYLFCDTTNGDDPDDAYHTEIVAGTIVLVDTDNNPAIVDMDTIATAFETALDTDPELTTSVEDEVISVSWGVKGVIGNAVTCVNQLDTAGDITDTSVAGLFTGGIDGTPGYEGQVYSENGFSYLCTDTDYTSTNDNWVVATAAVTGNYVYLDKNRTDSYIEDGTLLQPYKTPAALIDGLKVNYAALSDKQLSCYTVLVARGSYSWTGVKIPTFKSLRFEGNGVTFTGDPTIEQTPIGGSGEEPYTRIEFVGMDGFRGEKGQNFQLSGAWTFTRSNDSLTYICFKGCRVSGNWLFDTDGTFVLQCRNNRFSGTISTGTFTDPESAVLIESDGCSRFSGAITIKGVLYRCDNTEFSANVTCDSNFSAKDAVPAYMPYRITNCIFSNTANSFIGNQNLLIDSVSYKSLIATTETITFSGAGALYDLDSLKADDWETIAVAGEELTDCLAYFKTSDSKWYKAKADAIATIGVRLLWVSGTITNAGSGIGYNYKKITTTGLTVGAVYASVTTAGSIQFTVPNTPLHVIAYLGYATSTTEWIFSSPKSVGVV